MDPWFTEQAAGVVGGVLGAVIGGGFGGIGGGVGGPLAAMGKAKPLVLGIFYTAIVVGLALLGVGAYALIDGQPWYVWFSIGMPGGVTLMVMGPLLFVIKARYAQHEQRKLDADAIRAA